MEFYGGRCSNKSSIMIIFPTIGAQSSSDYLEILTDYVLFHTENNLM